MSELSEEEIIYIIEKVLSYKEIGLLEATDTFYQAIQGLLYLYQQEKERNKELYATCCRYEDKLGEYENTDAIATGIGKYIKLEELMKEDEIGIKGKRYISKDKIKELVKDIDETIYITKSDEVKFYMLGFKNSIQELLQEGDDKIGI